MRFGNILWNLLGLGLPLLIAAITVPKLIGQIGSERFGLLALAWAMIGYAGALDFGIGRATTQRVAALQSAGCQASIIHIVATAVRITQVSGLIGMLVILAAAALGAHRLIQVTTIPENELLVSVFMLALAVPMQAVSATYRGVNEAYLNFRGISILRIALGAANFGAPFLVSFVTKELYWLIATLVFSRLLALVFYRYLAMACLANRFDGNKKGRFRWVYASRLMRFGGWFTVSSIVSPLLVQADRFVVGFLISAAAVTQYVLPYELSIQMLVFASAVSSVAFPTISGFLAKDPVAALHEFRRWLLRMSLGMLLLTITLGFAMPYILRFWVGDFVSVDSERVGEILCVGVFFNSVGIMYFSLIHAAGKVKETAIIHLLEFPLYIILLVTLISEFGIVGCAIAWALRTFVDMLALIYVGFGLDKKLRAV